MTILYVYAHQGDEDPIMIFSGCPWSWDIAAQKLKVWDTPEGCYTFPVKKMYNTVNDKIFYACGEVEDEE